jgi:hypothetical protein
LGVHVSVWQGVRRAVKKVSGLRRS